MLAQPSSSGGSGQPPVQTCFLQMSAERLPGSILVPLPIPLPSRAAQWNMPSIGGLRIFLNPSTNCQLHLEASRRSGRKLAALHMIASGQDEQCQLFQVKTQYLQHPLTVFLCPAIELEALTAGTLEAVVTAMRLCLVHCCL